MTPRETVAAATRSLLRGDIGGVVRHFALPMAIEKNGVHHVVETESDLREAIAVLLKDLFLRGVRSARGKVLQDNSEADSAYLSFASEHLDGEGNVIDQARARYLMRRNGDGEWAIIVMAIDQACAYTPGACVLDERVA